MKSNTQYLLIFIILILCVVLSCVTIGLGVNYYNSTSDTANIVKSDTKFLKDIVKNY
jgi:hypothetical protein